MHKRYAHTHFALQAGVTLVETLVGITAGLIMMVGLISISSTAIQFGTHTQKRDLLNIELQTALNLMKEDIRRAGYWAQATNSLASGTNSNPFMASGTNMSINGSNDCILLSYDRDKNGSLNSSGNASSSEHFGFRLNDGAIQALTNDTDFSCTSSASSWVNITNPASLTITNLSFTINSGANQTVDLDGSGPLTSTVQIRYVTVSITGQVVNDTTATQTLTERVRVRNDKYNP